ncbi:MAG TPA: SUMF1/EgtB/PvdO family nonheme iron enzyme, partial [Polyangiaceae bacterium]|nr:SUMF1/EgtB/PvdO family nonheme iron enzyme [Polyangiaceae bacterium]
MLGLQLAACSRQPSGGDGEANRASPSGSAAPSPGGPPLGPPPDGPAPRVGMAFIPPGALVVGTPRDKRPRRPDRELPGEQVMLEGFYIDQLAYPNEEGAIPLTNVTRDEAELLCHERDKRLCSELEWERACKGPDNRTFEYGESYRESTCE